MAHGSTATRLEAPHSLAVRLADWFASIKDEDIPRAALRQASLLVLDAIGCGLAALDDDTGRAALSVLDAQGGAPLCAVIGRRKKANLVEAVAANGILIRTLDLNDYVAEPGGAIGGHPSDNIPAALAAAEAFKRSGRAALAAIVLGYEVYGRLKATLASRSAWDGVSVSGAVVPLVVGRLMGLDRDRLAHALALGLSQAAVSAVVRSGDISAAKSIANAMVAAHGSRAALLAARGVTGPLSVLDHSRGMKAVFSKLDAVPPLEAPLPARPYILFANVKAFPCLATGQSAVAAALALREKIADLDAIERLAVTMIDHPSIIAQQQDAVRLDPRSREAADHSFPFLVASALLDGEFGLAQFNHERWNESRTRALMKRVELTTSATLAQRAPERSFPCAIEAFGKHGLIDRVELLEQPGFSREGVDETVVRRKFAALASARLAPQSRARLEESVLAMDAEALCSQAIDPIRFAK